jgi:hypothetical protein
VFGVLRVDPVSCGLYVAAVCVFCPLFSLVFLLVILALVCLLIF